MEKEDFIAAIEGAEEEIHAANQRLKELKKAFLDSHAEVWIVVAGTYKDLENTLRVIRVAGEVHDGFRDWDFRHTGGVVQCDAGIIITLQPEVADDTFDDLYMIYFTNQRAADEMVASIREVHSPAQEAPGMTPHV